MVFAESGMLGLGDDAGRKLTVLRAIDKLDKFGPEGVKLLLGAGRKDESGDFTPGANLAADAIAKITGFLSGLAGIEDKVRGLEAWYGESHVLHGIDFDVAQGEVVTLLGRNGAGKTTTLRTIMGLWHASQGSIHFAGRDITALNTPQIAGMNIAYVPENMGIFADLTVKENMLLAARSARNAAQMDEARLQWIFKLFPAVEKFWNHPAGKLSGGQKQMVAVSRAIVEPRDLLIVDEPSKGLAPAIINNMIEAFDQLKKSGVTILLVEQNINFAKRLGDTVAVMDNGQVVHAGSMAALAEDEALQRSLLGLAL